MDLIKEVLYKLGYIQDELKNSNPDLAFFWFEEMTDVWAGLRERDYEAAHDLFNEITVGWRPDWDLRQFVLDW